MTRSNCRGRRAFGRILLAAASLCGTVGAGRAQVQAQPGGASDDQGARFERLVAELDALRRAEHIPGLAIAVVTRDTIIVGGLGVADTVRSTPVTAETLFPIGSTTKSFTATLVGMLVDEGAMGWDDPVTDYPCAGINRIWSTSGMYLK